MHFKSFNFHFTVMLFKITLYFSNKLFYLNIEPVFLLVAKATLQPARPFVCQKKTLFIFHPSVRDF